MRRMIYIFCLLAASCCLAQSAATARLGALGRNDSVVTNVTFGGPASQLTDGTNIITSVRDVLRVLAEDEPWSYTVSPTLPEGAAIDIAWGPTLYFPDDEQWYALVNYPDGGGPFPLGGSASSTNLVLVSTFAESSPEYTVTFTRHLAGETNFVGRLALTNDIPEISTNNAAFVAAVTNCPVVIAAADGITLGDFGEYGTLGSLLAALAAAITWLKANKANKTDLPYAFNLVTLTNSAATLQDRAVNTLTIAADCTLTLPAVNANGARDFLLRLDVGYVSDTTLPQITINLPTGETGCAFETDGDSFPVPDAEGVWCYSFTETAVHKFAVSLKSLTTVVQTALGGS